MSTNIQRVLLRYCFSCGSPMSSSSSCFLIDLTTSDVQLTELSLRIKSLECERNLDEIVRHLDSAPPDAFLVNKRCWRLLLEHFEDGELNIRKIFETIRERHRACYSTLTYAMNPPSFNRCFRNAGFHEAAQALPAKNEQYALRESSLVANPFEQIPTEMRLEIAAQLPTKDFLNLRLCSRAMAAIFESQAFWKTRFFINGDRGYLKFLLRGIHDAKDWRLIYRCTHSLSKLHPDLQARKRHWQRNKWMRDVCIMTRGQKLISDTQLHNTKALQWHKATGKIQCYRPLGNSLNGENRKLCSSCFSKHEIHTQSVPFSRDVVEVSISVLSDPLTKTTFIAGLELIYPCDMPNTVLGYRLPGNQIRIDLQGRSLRGFEVMTGEGGILAILPIFTTINEWIGKPIGGVWGSVRLSTEKKILALSADFDHSNLVGLAIGTDHPSS